VAAGIASPVRTGPANPAGEAVGLAVATNANLFLRTIYTGQSPYPVGNTPAANYGIGPLAAGALAMAPAGLGYLHYNNYMPDARGFYCPSAGGAMPPDHVPEWGNPSVDGGLPDGNIGDAPSPYGTWNGTVATGPRQLQQAGGFDAASLSRGNWNWVLSPSKDPWTNSFYAGFGMMAWEGRVIQCD
jgi:hypothetical protein